MPQIPKRSEQQLGHRTKAEKSRVTKVPVAADPVEAPPVDPEWHPIARDWFTSLAESGQSQFMEPSDWAAARFAAEVMTKNLASSRFSAQLFAAVWTAMNDLLTTEASRRKVRMEIERGGGQDEPADVAKLDDWRELYG